ncbi:gamma-glutamylcyclotransferase family protein [Benzoatithermus flavus]|uniref:Putative gamma-glutamylcyclotransferase n=1 Tax=Benzoatithermus flavus TaxID=3108223 RepID=A0ABU8XV13_9PROT
MIPLSAAGRQPLFFFGTLTDLDVLAYVLARPIDLDDLAPATIAGFRRVQARGASYPVLIPASGSRVEGLLLRHATRRDIARINHYESEEYRAELHRVATADGARHAAWLYLGLDHLEASDEPWELEAWQRIHKAGFFAACDGWMADFRELEGT